jgi:hypothetical protein
VSSEFLADCEGRKHEPVTLETQANGRALVSWSDRGVPQMAQYDTDSSEQALEFPALPEQLQAIEPGFWQALAEAVPIADQHSTRYALSCLHLRGASGQIQATDGHHILVQHGFSFPWQEDVLVPASGILGCSELTQQQVLQLGKDDDWLVVVAGAWSVFLSINKEGRFPKLDDMFRPAEQACSRLQLEASDARHLVDVLPRLPGGEEANHPVTLDLGGRVVIRAADEEQTAVTELTLTNSSTTGEPIAVHVNRGFLQRAARLRFQEICLFSPEAPMQCDDGRRRYLWALLDPKSILKPVENPVRIASPSASEPVNTVRIPTKRPITNMTNDTATNPKTRPRKARTSAPTADSTAEAGKIASPIEQALVLRTSLRETLIKTNSLISALKRQNRQSKLMQTTLAALEELRSAG